MLTSVVADICMCCRLCLLAARWITECAFVGLQSIQSTCFTDMEHIKSLFVLRAIHNAPSFVRRVTGFLMGRSGATLGRNEQLTPELLTTQQSTCDVTPNPCF
jgi:hypothetical protein